MPLGRRGGARRECFYCLQGGDGACSGGTKESTFTCFGCCRWLTNAQDNANYTATAHLEFSNAAQKSRFPIEANNALAGEPFEGLTWALAGADLVRVAHQRSPHLLAQRLPVLLAMASSWQPTSVARSDAEHGQQLAPLKATKSRQLIN